MILLSHATGNENVRQAALGLQEANLLGEFWTCLTWNPNSLVNRFLPKRVSDQLSRRSLPESVRPFARAIPSREIVRLFSGMVSIDDVLQDLDRKVAARLRAKRNFAAVYAYEDGAAESFHASKDCGIHRIYDLPIGYWRVAQRIYEEERTREPEWAETLTGITDSDEKLARKEEELKLAERIVVASSFTKQTLNAAQFNGSVNVIPYGAPAISQHEITAHTGPLRVLFAGSLGQRKGLSYLLQAVQSLGRKVELTLLGRKVSEKCPPLEAAVRQHRWIPTLPHGEVLREMRRHDVLVLPSLFEGFGLVIPEAMAQGLVVIASPHTAAPDLIEDTRDGFIVPIRSSEAIAQSLEKLQSAPSLLREIKLAARRKAGELRWEVYRRSLAQMAREVVS